MKRITLVLVLLLTLSLTASPWLVPSARAGEFEEQNPPKPDPTEDVLLDLLGDPDDGGKGDPGNMGDGFGADGGSDFFIGADGGLDPQGTILEEYLLLLTLMIQQLAP